MCISWLMIITLKGGCTLLTWADLQGSGVCGQSWNVVAFQRLHLLSCFIVLGGLQIIASYWMPDSLLDSASKTLAGISVFLVVMNTGFVMNCVNAIPLWNSALLPILFISCGILDGLGLTMIIGLLGAGVDIAAAESGTRLFLLLNALLIGVYLWTAAYAGPAGKESVREMIKGQLAALLWLGVVLCGIVVPLLISVGSFLAAVPSYILIAGIICEMVGAFSLKYVILKSGRYGPIIPA